MRPLSFPVEKRGSIENRSWKISHLRSSKPGAQRKRSNAGNVNREHSSRRIPRERERERLAICRRVGPVPVGLAPRYVRSPQRTKLPPRDPLKLRYKHTLTTTTTTARGGLTGIDDSSRRIVAPSFPSERDAHTKIYGEEEA